MHTCSRCHKTKPLTEFGQRGGKRMGKPQAYCKECERDYAAQPKQRARQKKYREKYYAENVELLKEKNRLYRELFPEKRRETKHRSYMRHKEHEKARNVAYRKVNRLQHVESETRRRFRKLATETEKVKLDYIFYRDNGICGICLKRVPESDVHFDHIIPLSRGGGHTYDNIQVAHSVCNMRKSNKIMKEME